MRQASQRLAVEGWRQLVDIDESPEASIQSVRYRSDIDDTLSPESDFVFYPAPGLYQETPKEARELAEDETLHLFDGQFGPTRQSKSCNSKDDVSFENDRRCVSKPAPLAPTLPTKTLWNPGHDAAGEIDEGYNSTPASQVPMFPWQKTLNFHDDTTGEINHSLNIQQPPRAERAPGKRAREDDSGEGIPRKSANDLAIERLAQQERARWQDARKVRDDPSIESRDDVLRGNDATLTTAGPIRAPHTPGVFHDPHRQLTQFTPRHNVRRGQQPEWFVVDEKHQSSLRRGIQKARQRRSNLKRQTTGRYLSADERMAEIGDLTRLQERWRGLLVGTGGRRSLPGPSTMGSR